MDDATAVAVDLEVQHLGPTYYDFMAEISQKRRTARYLEVGVNEGKLMSYVHADAAVGVDPSFVLTCNAASNKKRVTLIQETSDYFFSAFDARALLGGPPELVFLDGLHTFEYLLRDFYNTEAISAPNSLIVLHDCLPLDGVMAERHIATWQELTVGTRYAGFWTGDVWKLVPILKEFRPDLHVVFVDCPPTGLVCITNLDPSSRVLASNYIEIVNRYRKLPNSVEEIRKMYEGITIVSGHDVLKEFDHSLYFRL
jgi:hypothetical protein